MKIWRGSRVFAAKVVDLCSRYPRFFLGVTVFVFFIQFIDKAFHIDDPLFIWTAQHIWKAPFDFYGFDINWYGVYAPIAVMAKNPPLFSYYLAVWAVPFGWSEVSLHVACLLSAVGLVIGTYELAGLLNGRPMVSALLVFSAPVFIVSGTTVMCDMLMVSLWVWAVYFWVKGCRDCRSSTVMLGALFILLSTFTKYFAISLLPLLVVYSLWARVPWRYWRLGVFFVIVGCLGYQFWTQILYEQGLMTDAADYARTLNSCTGDRVIAGLAFAGIASVPVFLGLFARRVDWLWVAALIFAALVIIGSIFFSNSTELVQRGGWIALGLCGACGALGAIARRRCSPEGVLLCLWILGTLVFTIFLNWTVSARNVLPIVPAAALLAGRWWKVEAPYLARVATVALGMAFAVIGLIVARADYCWANGIRTSVARINEYAIGDSGLGQKRFQGHWGGQYYFQQVGWSPYTFQGHSNAGDYLAIPAIATNRFPLKEGTYIPLGIVPIEIDSLASVMGAGAGFYSNGWGNAPFVLGRKQSDVYVLVKLK